MKKTVFTLFLLASISEINLAQSLTKAEQEPVVGDLYATKAYDSTLAVPKSVGINQNWNFSSLVQTTLTASSAYISTTSLPSTSLLPGATLAEDLGGGEYNVYKSTTTPASQFELIGRISVTGNTANVLKYTNTSILYTWPMTSTTSFTDNYNGTVIGMPGSYTGTKTVAVTGSGSITMPNGTNYGNILQVKTNEKMVTSVSISTFNISYTTNITMYEYFHPTQKFPLIRVTYEINYDGINPADTSVLIDVNTNINVGIKKETNLILYTLYPNPAKNELNMKLDNPSNQNCFLTIENMEGKFVKSFDLGNDNRIETKLSIEELPPGIYFVKTKQGDNWSVKKIQKE
ncbi:MAG: T9SS type A sorting domain-containing protein [Bacteroidia bacterium]|nr:T9SS type A sorting domain-containing protein [Bacteroidia bacterium]